MTSFHQNYTTNRIKSLPLLHLMMNIFRTLVPSIEWAKQLTQQHQNFKQKLKWNLIKLHLTTHTPSTTLSWNYHISLQKNQLSLQTNLPLAVINLLLISSNGHSSNHLKTNHMHNNPPNIYIPWPLKVTLSLEFNNGGITFFRLLPIFINKKYLAGIKISLRRL